ncbi:MAG TPA: DUF1579 domain-containing protein [Thermoanaerobaculia bacterium]|nr:DUF1579 domain-containing protein [Thermoanaerobaculia bacterium]
MRKIAVAGFMAAVLAMSVTLAAQAPGMVAPTKEHEWLHQLAGQWEADLEVFAGPGNPPLKVKATENTRRIGGFWILSESEVTPPGMPFARALTLGYDPQKKKYVGTLVDSNSTHIGKYEGSMDAAGRTLTLEGEMPSPFDPAKSVRVREVIELKSRDQKVVTTSVQGEDGNWFTLLTVNARRKK